MMSGKRGRVNKSKETQVTNWNYPYQQMESEYGAIGYLDWCLLEIKRLAQKGLEYFIGHKKDKVCIMKRLKRR